MAKSTTGVPNKGAQPKKNMGKPAAGKQYLAQESFWNKIPSPFGPQPKYTAQTLWEKALEYFEWCNSNPLMEEKIFQAQGEIVKGKLRKMRAMTERAFCTFAGLDTETFRRYKTGENVNGHFQQIAQLIADCIYSQKFEGAAADLLNSNIIARELGLADKKQVDANVNLSDSEITFE